MLPPSWSSSHHAGQLSSGTVHRRDRCPHRRPVGGAPGTGAAAPGDPHGTAERPGYLVPVAHGSTSGSRPASTRSMYAWESAESHSSAHSASASASSFG